MFDFDGTLSLVRANWQGIMVPMMLDYLSELGTGESKEALTSLIEDFVIELTGKPTIFQMHRLVEEIGKRGGSAKTAEFYKEVYHDRLLADARKRAADMRSGAVTQERWAVGGAHAWLQELQSRGWTLYLASGTEIHFVKDELNALGLDGYFGSRVYAPDGDDTSFTKAAVVQRIMDECQLRPEQIAGFGDGVVETQDISRAGALAVGVATDEVEFGRVSPFKRQKLIEAGASLIIADYSCQDELLAALTE